jgi:hypothetical protein
MEELCGIEQQRKNIFVSFKKMLRQWAEFAQVHGLSLYAAKGAKSFTESYGLWKGGSRGLP